MKRSGQQVYSFKDPYNPNVKSCL